MTIILILTVLFVVSTISCGIVESHRKNFAGKKKVKKIFRINLGGFIALLTAGMIIMIPDVVSAATTTGVNTSQGMGYIAAALSTGLAAIGAGYAVGATGSSALGAVSEDPKILGKTLLYVGLAEGIALYGIVISILILQKL